MSQDEAEESNRAAWAPTSVTFEIARAGLTQCAGDRARVKRAGPRDQQRQAHAVGRIADNLGAQGAQSVGIIAAPAVERHACR